MALAPFGGSQALVTVGAQKFWQLRDSLPTGKVLDLDEARDMRQGRDYETLKLDDVLTDLLAFAYDPDDNLGLVV